MANIESSTSLKYIPYINYSVLFQKNPVGFVSALIDLGSKVNAMHLAYAKKFGLIIQKTDVRAQKFDGTTLEIFEIVITAFLVKDRAEKVCFFEEIFLLADININIALGMPFLTLSNANVHFTEWGLHWRSYIAAKVLPIIRHIELINRKEFATAALGKDNKAFVIQITSLTIGFRISIHLFRAAQLASLIADEAPVTVPIEYSDFADMFSPRSAAKLLEHTGINNYPIKLIGGQ